MEPFEQIMQRGGARALQEAARFFMHADPVYKALREIARNLDAMGVPYAVAGGMALVAHGCVAARDDVQILVTPAGFSAAHQSLDGLGYVPPFSGSRNLRDTQTGVSIEFLVTGQFPGDGKLSPVAFPDPDAVAVEIAGVHFVALPTPIELKLASGMTNPGRLRDLADVQELIRVRKLPADLAAQLNPHVRSKYDELWNAVAGSAEAAE